MLEKLEQGCNTDAVIDGLRQERRSHTPKLRGKTCAIAHLCPARRTSIDTQRIHGNLSCILIPAHQVDGLRADHSGCPLSSHKYLLPHQMANIDPAHRFEAIQTLALIIHDHEADFVHVCVEHHACPLPPASCLGDQHTAQRVHLHFIGVGLHFLQNDLSHLALVSRDSDDIAKPFKQSKLRCPKGRHKYPV